SVQHSTEFIRLQEGHGLGRFTPPFARMSTRACWTITLDGHRADDSGAGSDLTSDLRRPGDCAETDQTRSSPGLPSPVLPGSPPPGRGGAAGPGGRSPWPGTAPATGAPARSRPGTYGRPATAPGLTRRALTQGVLARFCPAPPSAARWAACHASLATMLPEGG